MTVAVRELDVRQVEPAAVLEAFAGLSPGERLVLFSEAHPQAVLSALQRALPRAFDWSLLEQGPDRVRVELRRREGEKPRGVTEYLSWDHDRLDRLVQDAAAAAAAGRVEEARAGYAEFRCGLERHIRMEEDILFPYFEQVTGIHEGGPTAVMRMEHLRIHEGLDEASMALQQADTGGFRDVIAALLRVLEMHNVKEERILYPSTDGACESDEARERLVRKMQQV